MSRVVKENSSMQLQMRYRYHCGRCLWICAVWVSSWHFCGIGGSGGVYCLRVFYNQPHCCKGLKVCMNGRIFSCRRGNKQCENSWKKCGDSRIGETPWLKKWGAQAPRPNRSLRLWTSWLLKESIRCYNVFRRSTSKTAGQPLLAVEWLVAQLETAKKHKY